MKPRGYSRNLFSFARRVSTLLGKRDRTMVLDGRDYDERIRQEVLHYEQVFKGRLTQEVPAIWEKVEERFADAIQAATGVRNLYAYVARHV